MLGLAVPEDGTVLVDHDWPARLVDGVAKKVRIGGVKIISMCNTAGMGIYKSDISKKKFPQHPVNTIARIMCSLDIKGLDFPPNL